MKTINFFEVLFLVVACVGIVVFWVAGINDKIDAATYSFLIAGAAAWLSLAMKVVGYLYKKNNPF